MYFVELLEPSLLFCQKHPEKRNYRHRGSKWMFLWWNFNDVSSLAGVCVCVPGRQLQSQVRWDGPGQVDVVLPLLLRHAAVLGPPVCDAGLQRRLRGDGQLWSGQRVVPYRQPLDLVGLRRDATGRGISSDRFWLGLWNPNQESCNTKQNRGCGYQNGQQKRPTFHVVLVQLRASVALFRQSCRGEASHIFPRSRCSTVHELHTQRVCVTWLLGYSGHPRGQRVGVDPSLSHLLSLAHSCVQATPAVRHRHHRQAVHRHVLGVWTQTASVSPNHQFLVVNHGKNPAATDCRYLEMCVQRM